MVKEELLEVFGEFFNGGVNKKINVVFVLLISKKDNTLRVKDFRLISSVISLYKIIAKVLSLQLRDVFDSTISLEQVTFVREILDTILVAKEVG